MIALREGKAAFCIIALELSSNFWNKIETSCINCISIRVVKIFLLYYCHRTLNRVISESVNPDRLIQWSADIKPDVITTQRGSSSSCSFLLLLPWPSPHSSLSFLVAVLLPAFLHNAAIHGAEPVFVFSENRYWSNIFQCYVASCFSYVCLYIREAGE